MVYGVISIFVSDGPGEGRQLAEWVHKFHEISQRVRIHHPAASLLPPLLRLLETPDVDAFASTLTDEDPWVRALSRLHLGKMRVMLGHTGREADTYLETAVAEFRALGERFGISFAQTELADRIAARGEFARACEHYEEAIAAVAEIGSADDVIRMRSRQAQLYWLMGDED